MPLDCKRPRRSRDAPTEIAAISYSRLICPSRQRSPPGVFPPFSSRAIKLVLRCSLLRGDAQLPETPIQVGLVGFGFAGSTFHAPIIDGVDGLHLAAILQRNSDSAAQAYPGARVVRSLSEMLALDSISLMVVATPNDSHSSIARECLLAGCDVVIDKPFAPTYTEATE